MVVGDWIDQELPAQGWTGFVADAQRGRRREVAAGAVAPHSQPLAIRFEFGRMPGNPAGREHAVVQARGEFMFGRQAGISTETTMRPTPAHRLRHIPSCVFRLHSMKPLP